MCIGVTASARALLPDAEVRLGAQSLCAGNPHAFALRELFAEQVSDDVTVAHPAKCTSYRREPGRVDGIDAQIMSLVRRKLVALGITR